MADRDRLDELRIERTDDGSGGGRSRRWLVAGISGLAVAVVGWWWLAADAAIEVDTATVAEAPAGSPRASVLDAAGYVVARRQATVSAEITGRLVEVAIEEGMAVEEGQILARLDDANARRALELAEARASAATSGLEETRVRLREAERDLARLKKLEGDGVVSESSIDDARAERDSLSARLVASSDDVKVAEREVAVRRQALEDTLIRAPFDGVAITKDAQAGEIVSPMSAGGGFTRTGIGTIVDMGSLEIEVEVNETYIQRVRSGQPVIATLDAYRDWQIPAHVITTVPAADRQKATVKVRIAFEKLGDPRILPDMGVKVAFQAEADPASEARARLEIPERAVRREGESAVVFVVRDGRAERRAVTVGGAAGEKLEVRSGLRSGERVVLDPPADLADGARVRQRTGTRNANG